MAIAVGITTAHTLKVPHVKTAISLPEEMFVAISARAAATRISRSALIAEAIASYLQTLRDEEFTRQLNEAEAAVSDEDFEQEARWRRRIARQIFERMSEVDGGWPAP